jgi:hypothetical protein
VQYEIARMLAEKTRNICVVGDIDQMIYSWRGADIQNILNFEKDYPEAKVVFLKKIIDRRRQFLPRQTMSSRKMCCAEKKLCLRKMSKGRRSNFLFLTPKRKRLALSPMKHVHSFQME